MGVGGCSVEDMSLLVKGVNQYSESLWSTDSVSPLPPPSPSPLPHPSCLDKQSTLHIKSSLIFTVLILSLMSSFSSYVFELNNPSSS